METKNKTYLYVVIAKSFTSFIAIMKVPNFDTGWKVVKELREIEPNEVFSLVSDTTNYKDVKSYKNWSWKFQR